MGGAGAKKGLRIVPFLALISVLIVLCIAAAETQPECELRRYKKRQRRQQHTIAPMTTTM